MGTATRLRAYLRRWAIDLTRRRTSVRVVESAQPDLVENPVFILGLYRSGTTLVRYVLDSHSRFGCPPEAAFLGSLDQLVNDPRNQVGFESMGFSPKHVTAQARHFASYFFENYARSLGKARWVDKSPNHVDHLDFIHDLYPEARHIVLLRHPLDQVNSHTIGGTTLPPRLTPYQGHPGEDPRLAGARYWREKTDKVLDFHDRSDTFTTLLRYEELVADPEPELRKIFLFLGEDWEEAVLDFSRHPHDVGLEDDKAARSKGFEPSVGNYLTWPPSIREECAGIVAETMVRAGYPLMPARSE